MMATELEFYIFENSYDNLRDGGLSALKPISGYNEDYHIFQTTKEEGLMRAVRNGLYGAGIPVENTKGEADAGQHEVNYRYSDALDTADNHTIVKQAVKEIAHAQGKSVTFMAKYDHRKAGIVGPCPPEPVDRDGKPAFFDPDPHGMSALMKHFLAGQLAHAEEITAFLAPYVNSYKRFCIGLFAPTKAVWSADNRTAGFRICGLHTKAIRVECRIPGSDVNPYLTCAALLAAGLDGIEQKLALEPEQTGDMYTTGHPRDPEEPARRRRRLDGSAMLRAAFGDDVVDHYVHNAAMGDFRDRPRRDRFRTAAPARTGAWPPGGKPRPPPDNGGHAPRDGDGMKPIQLISPSTAGSMPSGCRCRPRPRESRRGPRPRRAKTPGRPARWPSASRWSRPGCPKLNEMKEVVVEELAWQMGRPIRFGGEFGGVNARTDYMADIAAETLAPRVIEDSAAFRRYLAREPLGVVFIVAPWNYPYLTTINTLVPALIAGNTVILKHASQTLLVGERLAEAFHAAGVPADVFQNVVLDHATTEALIGRPRLQLRQLHRLGRRRAGDGAGSGGHLHAARAGTGRQGSRLCPRRCQPRCGRRHADGRGDVQLGPMLLRDRADLCPRKPVRRLRRKGGGLGTKALKLGNPFDPDHAWPDGQQALCPGGARPDRRGNRMGARPLIDPANFPADDGGAYLRRRSW
jgi:hypothetical protein